MKAMMLRLAPSATTIIRMDHMHVLSTFHSYRIDSPPNKKRMLVDTISMALEIHAKLEEEIFYPAMRRYAADLVDKSVPEHNEMRRLIARLREIQPTDQGFDSTVMELMRDVMRHVADEETILLPEADRVLGDRLDELGAQMTRRRFELAGPRADEIAVNTVRSFPGATLAVTGAVVLVAFLGGLAFARSPRIRALPASDAIRKFQRARRAREIKRALMGRLKGIGVT
ncbi:MAG TPA: hemerythrin domain-containing protein [Casimicrobiaceae bacterium]|jgi:hemerythrin-like domain-containing protein